MFRRFFQNSLKADEVSLEENRQEVSLNDSQVAEPASRSVAASNPSRGEPVAPRGLASGFDSFAEIYRRAMSGARPSAYSSLKVAEMIDSPHVAGMSNESKRSSVMMALEVAGVHVSDVLQDAMLRQRALDEYEEAQRKKLIEFELAMGEANRNMQAEAERIAAEYTKMIQANIDEVTRQQAAFRAWQIRKEQDVKALMAASAFCAQSGGGGSAPSFSGVAEPKTRR